MTDAKPTRVSRPLVVSFRLTDAEAARVDAAIEAMATRWKRRSDWCRAAALHAAKARAPDPAPVHRQPRRQPAHDVQLLGRILGQVGQVHDRLRALADAAASTGGAPEGVMRQMAVDLRAIGEAVRGALGGGRS